ncbi:sulfotransferase [Thalassoglobus sp. JC818]|uniref:sulfotransferase n=1 Tax=Thalassoglobus sp. JC818 TaxID=3232136 RepID=UPI0034579CB3
MSIFYEGPATPSQNPLHRLVKKFTNLANIPLANLSNRGVFFERFKTHVVMCGFPRSGTTLCQLMIQTCSENVQAFPKEERALRVTKYVIKREPTVVSKRPNDIFDLDQIRASYNRFPATPRFVLFTRDPRAVLTSMHENVPGEYYVSVDRWKSIWTEWTRQTHQQDVLTIKYEDLVTNADSVQQQIAAHTGLEFTQPFTSFHQNVPAGFDKAALNGVRPLETKSIERWRGAQHRDRIAELLDSFPELTDRLIDLGYESDDAWATEYRESLRTNAA